MPVPVMRIATAGLLLTACYSTKKVCKEAATFEPSAEIGTGADQFELFEEGALLTPVFGPQGGFHIWGAVRVTGLNPGDGKMTFKKFRQVAKGRDVVSLQFTLDFEDEVIGPRSVDFLDFMLGDVAQSETSGQTVFVDLWDVQEAYPDREQIDSVLSVTVEDACGTSVSDSRVFSMQLADIEH
jgi:hypothetical protein